VFGGAGDAAEELRPAVRVAGLIVGVDQAEVIRRSAVAGHVVARPAIVGVGLGHATLVRAEVAVGAEALVVAAVGRTGARSPSGRSGRVLADGVQRAVSVIEAARDARAAFWSADIAEWTVDLAGAAALWEALAAGEVAEVARPAV